MHGQIEENHFTDARNAGLGTSMSLAQVRNGSHMTMSNTRGLNSRLPMAHLLDRRYYEFTRLIFRIPRITLAFLSTLFWSHSALDRAAFSFRISLSNSHHYVHSPCIVFLPEHLTVSSCIAKGLLRMRMGVQLVQRIDDRRCQATFVDGGYTTL
jgi:hypothetical protein